MTKAIAQILDKPEQIVAGILSMLEGKNNYPSHDARHLAENVQKIRAKLTDLGLDPDDTTGEELYHSLLVKFEEDSQQFDAEEGVENADFDKKTNAAFASISKHTKFPQQWALKNSMAKHILRIHPPKRVMHQLHYRSVESLLKRENVAEIFIATHYLESGSWQKIHQRMVSSVQQTSLEFRPLKIQPLSYSRWAGVKGPTSHIAEDNDIGAVAIWPSNDIKDVPTLSIMLLLLESLAFSQSKTTELTGKYGQAVAWWKDTDSLIASLGSEHVSLNLKDTAINKLHSHSYENRILETSRRSFWQQLLSRYQNQLEIEEDLISSAGNQLKKLTIPANQPALEFVENLQESI